MSGSDSRPGGKGAFPPDTDPQIADTIDADSVDAVPTIPDTPGAHDVDPKHRLPSGVHRGGQLGRYTILDILGSGGMGVVIAAYDPKLDRKVAIKVLRTRRGSDTDRESARLRREATAMGQLSHPHVVTVYDTGEIDGRVFIAMEYVEGQTLREWLAAKRRSTNEILDTLVKAGRGLAAGHAAGLVHRDFKPDNVLVGNDGRVRVIDFGLARPDPGAAALDSRDITDSSQQLNQRLTTVGSLFGTPLYMAPEQHERLTPDARADQFAFCVALYEALTQSMPFAGETYQELAQNVTNGNLRQPAASPLVPQRVIAAIVKGLSLSRSRRFESMEALLAELEPRTSLRGRALLAAVGGAVVAAGLTLGIVSYMSDGRASAAPCDGGEERLAGVWDDKVRAAVRTAFSGSERRHAKATWQRLESSLDAYATGWVGDRKRICIATKVDHEQSARAFDRGMRCMRQRRAQLGALTELFAEQPDAELVDNAVAAVSKLAQTKDCVDTEALASAVPLPASDDDRRALDELYTKSAEVGAYLDTHKFAAAKDTIAELRKRSAPLSYPPLEALLSYQRGLALSGLGEAADAERELRGAMELATEAKDDRLLADIHIKLVYVVGFQLAKHADGLALEQAAKTWIGRADGGDAMTGRLAFNVGSTHFRKGEYAKAKQEYERALDLLRKAFGDEHPQVASTINSLGGTLMRLGDIVGAREQFEKSVAINTKVLGPEHPGLAQVLANLGGLAQLEKNWPAAADYTSRALAIFEETLGPKHVSVGLLLNNLGEIERTQNNCKQAIAHYTRALGILGQLGDDNPYVAYPLVGRAACRAELDDGKAGVEDGQRAVKILGSQAGDPAQLAEAQFSLAQAKWVEGSDKRGARALADKARAALAAAGAPGADVLARIDTWLKDK